MDIEVLLALQNLREGLPEFVEWAMVALSFLGDGVALVAIVLIVYWCIDKRAGQLALASFSIGFFANQMIKCIACVDRPWVRDARIQPAPGAIGGATGYSFPSGHSTGSGTVLGSLAWAWRDKRRILSWAIVVLVALIAFSRMFHGVHTPQDVLVGLGLAVIAIFLAQRFIRWIDYCDAVTPGHNKDIVVAIAVIAVTVGALVFMSLKPYPPVFADGQMTSDLSAVLKNGYETVGLIIGIAAGWLCERRFVGFETASDMPARTRVLRGVMGVAIVGAVYALSDVGFKAIMPYLWAKLFSLAILTFVALFVVPLAFEAISRRKRAKAEMA